MIAGSRGWVVREVYSGGPEEPDLYIDPEVAVGEFRAINNNVMKTVHSSLRFISPFLPCFCSNLGERGSLVLRE